MVGLTAQYVVRQPPMVRFKMSCVPQMAWLLSGKLTLGLLHRDTLMKDLFIQTSSSPHDK